ncbi:MAG: hypothetical protein WC876_01745 [Candidatus Thermoplasmatota archaeon]|jgi:hypothetical protein
MGAQATKEILDRIWANASPGVKQQLADSVLARVLAEAQSDDKYSGLNSAVARFVAARAEAEMGAMDLPAKFKSAVNAAVAEQWVGHVERSVRESLKAMSERFFEHLGRMSR